MKKLTREKRRLLFSDVGAKVSQVKEFRLISDTLSTEVRIEKLKRFAEFKIPNHKPYRQRRKLRFSVTGICSVCRVYEANCQHHIIMLCNGGSNKSYNRIPICNECHSRIHNWVRVDPETLRTHVPDEILQMDKRFADAVS